MKTSLPLCSLRLLAVSAAAASLVAELSAAERFWADAAGQTTWSLAASWSNGLPSNSAVTDTATFLSVANAQPVLTANRSINGIDFQMAAGGLDFTSTGTGTTLNMGSTGIDATGQLSGTNTVSVENITMNGNPTWTLFSNTDSATTSTFTVNSNININGQNWVVSPSRNSAAGNAGVVNFTGVLSGSLGATGLQLYATSFRNTINLSGANTYTGKTSIRAEVVANSLANAGSASSLGQSGDIVLGNNGSSATLTFNNLAADGATDRLLLFQGTGTSNYSLVNNSATGRVSFNNSAAIGSAASATANALSIRFAGTNTGLNSFGQIIHDRANSGITNVRKEGAGTWVLAGNNTYDGTTTVTLGSLFINGDQSSANGAVDVSSTAKLGGIGTIGGAVTLSGTSQLTPGANGLGQLTLNNGLTLNVSSGGGMSFEIGGSGGVKGVDFDSLVVSAGSVSLGTTASLSITAVNGFNLFQAGTYDLYDIASSPTGDFTSVSVAGTSLANSSGIWTGSSAGYDFTFTTGTGVFFAAVSAIPEPASIGLLAGFSVLSGVALRRRRRC